MPSLKNEIIEKLVLFLLYPATKINANGSSSGVLVGDTNYESNPPHLSPEHITDKRHRCRLAEYLRSAAYLSSYIRCISMSCMGCSCDDPVLHIELGDSNTQNTNSTDGCGDGDEIDVSLRAEFSRLL